MTLHILPRSSWTDTPPAWPTYPSRLFTKAEVTYLAPHYPAIPRGIWDDQDESAEQEWIRTIRSWHVDGNGWADIGYALVIFQSGRVYMAGGITHSTAHAASMNRFAIGVLFMVGNDQPPSAAAVQTFNELGPWLRDTQGFTRLATVTDHGRLPGQSTSCAGPHIRAAVDRGDLTLTGAPTMPIAENGWPTIRLADTSTFLAPNGKIVYTRNPDVATILGYVAWRWHFSVGPIAAASILEGDSETDHRGGVRDGRIIAIHAWRPAARISGSTYYSNHGTGMAMDVNGHLHPYEYTAPKPYDDGFTLAQLMALRRIKTEVRALAGGADILRLGIDFPSPRRDGMHVELWATAAQITACAAAIRAAGWLVPTRRGDIASYQAFVGTDADDFHGPGTTATLRTVQHRLGIDQTGRWDLATQTGTVQEALTRHGFDPGPVDAIPGPLYRHALRAFQSAAGLVPDAIPGRLTLAALAAYVAPRPPAPPTPTEPAPAPEPPVLVDPPGRIAGTDRWATAAAGARQAPPELRRKVYLAVGDGPTLVDAVAAPPDGVVLLVRYRSKTLPGATAAALADLRPEQVHPLGSPDIIPIPAVLAARTAAGLK